MFACTMLLLSSMPPASSTLHIAPPKAYAKIELNRFANIPDPKYSLGDIGTVLTMELVFSGQGGVAISDIPPGSKSYFATEAHGKTAGLLEPSDGLGQLIALNIKASIFSRLPNNASITLPTPPRVIIKTFAGLSPAYESSFAKISLNSLTAQANLAGGSPSDFKNVDFPTVIPNVLGIEFTGNGNLQLFPKP
jgi:hypothetical protein